MKVLATRCDNRFCFGFFSCHVFNGLLQYTLRVHICLCCCHLSCNRRCNGSPVQCRHRINCFFQSFRQFRHCFVFPCSHIDSERCLSWHAIPCCTSSFKLSQFTRSRSRRSNPNPLQSLD